METEIKLSFKDKEELFSVINADWFSDYCLDTAQKEPVLLENTYYDTRDRRLEKKGASLRIRRFEKDDEVVYEHTVKYGGAVTEGLHQRYEWNVISDTSDLDMKLFMKQAGEADDPIELLQEVMEGITVDELEPLCGTSFERTKYTFGFGDSIMEACFDYGTIRGGSKTETICELELELESGDVVDLKEMGQFIVDNTSGKPFNETKFKRCLNLLEDDGL